MRVFLQWVAKTACKITAIYANFRENGHAFFRGKYAAKQYSSKPLKTTENTGYAVRVIRRGKGMGQEGKDAEGETSCGYAAQVARCATHQQHVRKMGQRHIYVPLRNNEP